jgi:hypothetical protein
MILRMAQEKGKLLTRTKLQNVAYYIVYPCNSTSNELERPDSSSLASGIPPPGPFSLFAASLIVASLAIVTTNGNDDSTTENEIAVSKSAASAILSTMHVAVQNHRSVLLDNMMIYKELLAALLNALLVSSSCQEEEPSNEVTKGDGSDTIVTAALADPPRYNDTLIEFRIVTSLARALQINAGSTEQITTIVTSTITSALHLDQGSDHCDDMNVVDGRFKISYIATILAFAVEFRPWGTIDSGLLIQLAVKYNLWNNAEQICKSVTTTDEFKDSDGAIQAVHILIDCAVSNRG